MGFIKKILCSVLIIFLFFITTGCANLFKKDNSSDIPAHEASPTPLPIDPYEQATEVEITLYYKHEIADFLVPEKRTVIQEKKTIEQLVIEELLKGPQNFERRLIMPPGTELIDVTRRGDTVFVNLTDDFLNPIDLSTLPGKENVAAEDKAKVQAEMKCLAVYSIVNSLTCLDGVNQVKLMINNTQLSYTEMGTELLIEGNTNINPDSPMIAIQRNKNVILTPSKTVRIVMNALTGVPNWDSVYLLLSNKTMDGSTLPPLDEFKSKIPPIVGGMIAFEGNPVLEEEFLGDKAFVTVQYTDKTTEPAREIQEALTVDSIEGIWKVRLPAFISQYTN